MPQHVLIEIGEHWGRASAWGDGYLAQTQWQVSRDPQMKSLADWLGSMTFDPAGHWYFCSKQGMRQLERRLGSAPALIVTSGFKDWLDLHRPLNLTARRLDSKRAPALVPADRIFEVSERVGANGEILTPLATADLEFLASKLKLLDIKQVAIGFLHSVRNSTHEMIAAEFFQAQGFRVSASHRFPGPGTEIDRWLSAAAELYLQDQWESARTRLVELATGAGAVEGNLHFSFSGAGAGLSVGLAEQLFGWHQLVQRWLKTNGYSQALHLGWEGFEWISIEETDFFSTNAGRLSLRRPQFRRLETQPTQTLMLGPWGDLSWSRNEAGLEPGPMLFGRSSVPQLLDLLWLRGHLDGQSMVQEMAHPKMSARVREAILANGRRAFEQNIQPEALADALIKAASQTILVEALTLAKPEPLVVVGELASSLRPQLSALAGSEFMLFPEGGLDLHAALGESPVPGVSP